MTERLTKPSESKNKAAAHGPKAPSLTAFATANQMSGKALRAAIERGEISSTHFVGTPNGRAFASFEAAQAAQAELTAHREAQRDAVASGGKGAPSIDLSGVDFDDPGTWPWDLDGLRAVREHWAAKQTKLKTELASGELVRAVDVRNDAFKAFRTARDQVLAIPDQVGNDLAAAVGATDTSEVKRVIRERLERTLSDLGRALKTADTV